MSKSAAVVFPTNPIDHFSCSRFLKELFAPTINPTAPIAVTAVLNGGKEGDSLDLPLMYTPILGYSSC